MFKEILHNKLLNVAFVISGVGGFFVTMLDGYSAFHPKLINAMLVIYFINVAVVGVSRLIEREATNE